MVKYSASIAKTDTETIMLTVFPMSKMTLAAAGLYRLSKPTVTMLIEMNRIILYSYLIPYPSKAFHLPVLLAIISINVAIQIRIKPPY